LLLGGTRRHQWSRNAKRLLQQRLASLFDAPEFLAGATSMPGPT
jgi:ABC-type uncharacterized transport system auxiliary subunit